ncbi:MAG: glycosyltransferase family 2 protein [Elusimicrobia bacterium]|nr:glycosyltransferase family 2 protein [Elusimicrobiota bacterium]
MKISVVIITKNEQDDLPYCLENVKWADEIIVVDSGSTDTTVDTAKRFGAKVFERKWEGYGIQKNFAIDKAVNKWVLSIDADEVISPELQREIKEIIKGSDDYVAFKIPRKLIFQGKFLRWGGCYPDYQIRLFRKGKARFNLDLVHEKLDVDGKIGRLKNSLEHHSYKNLSDYFERFNRYTTLNALKRFDNKNKFYLWQYLYAPIKFIKIYFLKLGFLDGSAGLNWALLCSFFDIVKFLKLKELHTSGK